jgi:toxin ParE1/3/4
LEAIWLHSVETWSLRQAETYISGLYAAFDQLAEMPGLGRKSLLSGREYRRFEFKSHSIFYRVESSRIYVVRILHQRMESERHL